MGIPLISSGDYYKVLRKIGVLLSFNILEYEKFLRKLKISLNIFLYLYKNYYD